MAERSTCGSRTTLVFRYPLGLALFVVSAAAGVVVPTALHAPFHMPIGEAVFCVAFMALFWLCLGSFILRMIRSMANTDADKLSYSLGLSPNAPGGFAATGMSSTHRAMRTSFVRSSADGKLFTALGCTALTAAGAVVLWAIGDGFGGEFNAAMPWVFVAVVLVFCFGPWMQYLYCKRYPTIWQIAVDRESLVCTKNGTLVERILRSDIALVRYDQQQSPSKHAEAHPTIKFDMNDGSTHVICLSKLHHYDHTGVLTALAFLWGDELFSPAARFVVWQADWRQYLRARQWRVCEESGVEGPLARYITSSR